MIFWVVKTGVRTCIGVAKWTLYSALTASYVAGVNILEVTCEVTEGVADYVLSKV